MHPALRSKLANLVKHNDSRAIIALMDSVSDPHERQHVRLAAQHVERSRRHRERHHTGATIDLTPGR